MKSSFRMKECSKTMLQNIIKQMMIVDKYINIRITDEFVDASSYLPAHDVVKYMRVPNNTMFSNPFDLEKPIRISFISGPKLLVLLSQFESDDNIDIEVTYDSQSEGDEYYAMKVVMIGEKLKITEVCADQRYDSINIKPIPDDTMKSLLNTEGSEITFKITKEDLRSIKSLGTIDKDGKRFEYVVKNEEVSIRERSDYDVEDSIIYNKVLTTVDDAEDKTYLCGKNVLGVMNHSGDYEVSICIGDTISKVVYTHSADDLLINVIACI